MANEFNLEKVSINVLECVKRGDTLVQIYIPGQDEINYMSASGYKIVLCMSDGDIEHGMNSSMLFKKKKIKKQKTITTGKVCRIDDDYGTIEIPKEIWKAVGLSLGDPLEICVNKHGDIVLVKRVSADETCANYI